MEGLADLAQALEASPFGAWARGSRYAYPVANVIHLLGLVTLVGAIGILDLRIMGLFRKLPVAELSRALTPIAIGGLILMVPSGFTMFAADAGPLFRSDTFRWKMGLLALALANAAAFRVLWPRLEGAPPLAARAMALISIGLWLWIGALGRLIAYN